MKSRRTHPESGNAMIEFILVGIGLMFMLFSVFEMCRGVWIYTTLAHAIKAGTRYAVVHGKSCIVQPNNCPSGSLTVAAVAQEIQRNARALQPAKISITAMTVNAYSVAGTPCAGAASGICLSGLLTDTTHYFPLDSLITPTAGSPGDLVTISATYPFNTFMSMFWPGSRAVGPFGLFNLPAIGQQKVEF